MSKLRVFAKMKTARFPVTLSFKMGVVISCIGVVVFVCFGVWSHYSQEQQMEEQMLAEVRVLNTSVNATWQFIDYEQNNINYDRDGVYNFKGIYCSLVGKAVGEIFSRDTGYTYRLGYVRMNPRSAHDEPDAFEKEALLSFEEGNQHERYEITLNEEGEEVFRYVGAIYLTENCMDCHGGPKGEVDVTGFEKEGLDIGDIGGAVSISMPTDAYRAAADANFMRTGLMMAFFLTIALVAAVIFFRRNVAEPVKNLEIALEDIGRGNLGIKVHDVGGSSEMVRLAEGVQEMANELTVLYETLEEKVSQRTAQYKEANEALKRQRAQIAEANELLKRENEYRTNIVAILSHELRTPLTSIVAYVDLYERLGDEIDSGEAREYVEKIKVHSQSLLEMVTNVLDIAKLDAGEQKLAHEPVDVVDLSEEIVSVSEAIAIKKNLTIASEIDERTPLFFSDWAQLKKVLMNLMSNAVKFTNEGGTIALVVTYDDDDQTVVFTVADTGIGIPADKLDGIFDRFTQVDPSITRKYGGSGLGLSLVKKTVDLLGGSVSVKSELGRGSSFSVRLPVDAVDEEGFQ